METLQILTINWSHLFNAIMLAIALSSFVIARNRYIKQTVNKDDLDKLEKKMDIEDNKLSCRIDKVENHISEELKEIKQQNRDIMQYLLNHKTNRNS